MDLRAIVIVCVVGGLSLPAYGQDKHEFEEFVGQVGVALKEEISSATVYVPAGVFGASAVGDWASSQTFFEHGHGELNPRYSRKGFPAQRPMSFGDGNKVIVGDIVTSIGVSLVQNVAVDLTRDFLLRRYPRRGKLIRTLVWIEKTSFATWLTYWQSSQHFAQWQKNLAMADKAGW